MEQRPELRQYGHRNKRIAKPKPRLRNDKHLKQEKIRQIDENQKSPLRICNGCNRLAKNGK